MSNSCLKLKSIIKANFKLLDPQPPNKKLKVYCCIHCSKEYTMHTTRLSNHLYKECLECPPTTKVALKKLRKRSSRFCKKEKENKLLLDSSMEFEDSDILDESSKKLLQDQTSNIETNSSCSSPSIIAPKIQKKLWTVTHFCDNVTTVENRNLQELLAFTIFATGVPLSLVENSFWNQFFHKLRPAFTLPSRNDVSTTLLDLSYERMKKQVDDKVLSAHCLGMQFDGWSNLRNEGIINVILTTPEPIFYETIETKSESHTAVYIAEKIGEIIEKIGKERIFGICTDNAANMKAAWNILEKQYEKQGIVFYGCVAHILNLLLKDLASLLSIDIVIKQAVSVVKEVKLSQILTAVFVEIQKSCSNNVKKSLKFPVKTRFGSNVHCLESVIENKHNLQSLAIAPKAIVRLSAKIRNEVILNENFWLQATQVLNLLKPIAVTLTKFESDTPSISIVAEAFQKLNDNFEEEFKESSLLSKEECNQAFTFLKKRKEMAIRSIHLAANILDPVYKGLKLTDEETLRAQSFIFDLAQKFKLDQAKVVRELTDYMLNKGIWKEKFVQQASVSTAAEDWWRAACKGTQLSIIASRILPLHSTATATERSFSSFGWIHDKKRNKLTAQRAGKITYIAHNARLLKKGTSSQRKDTGIINFNKMYELSDVDEDEDESSDNAIEETK